MITFSRSLARRLRITFSRGMGITARQSAPAIEFHADADGLTIRTHNDEIAIAYHLPGEQPEQHFAVPFELLRTCEGSKGESVTLTLQDDMITAEWTDSSIPQMAQFELQSLDAFPDLPERMVSNPSRLIDALSAAVEVSDPDSTRYALNHLRLRSADGQIAATDSRHLLLQSGFAFPWENELLIPANRMLASPDLRRAEDVMIGHTDGKVCLRTGPWTTWLTTNETARFPQVDDVVPAVGSSTSTMLISDIDADFLIKTVKRLPSNDPLNHPVTLDLNGAVSIRSRGSEETPPTEVVLTSSRRDGDPIRISTNRNLLARAVAMGFRTVEVHSQESPLVCRDADRTYVWAALGKDGIVGSDPNAVRIESASSGNIPPTTLNKETTPAMSDTKLSTPRNRLSQSEPESDDCMRTPLQAAEALRDSLKESLTHTRELIAALKKRKKQSRLVENTLASLKQLQDVA